MAINLKHSLAIELLNIIKVISGNELEAGIPWRTEGNPRQHWLTFPNNEFNTFDGSVIELKAIPGYWALGIPWQRI